MEEIEKRTRNALDIVGLDVDEVRNLPPIALSGGMRRRVAIAGVLAMQPEIIILDEPTAGLDPRGRDLILGLIKKIQQEKQVTIIMVSHHVRDMILFADQLIVLEKGRLLIHGDTRSVLQHSEFKASLDMMMPDYLQVIYSLAARGKQVDTNILFLHEAEREIERLLMAHNHE